MDTGDFWKNKLMAFLHDPPCKCFDIGRHEQIAEGFRREAGITPEDMKNFFEKSSDWSAAAADRFPFPERKCASKFTGDEEYPFKHPMGGGELIFKNPVETAELAEQAFQNSIGGIPKELDDWRAKFFLYWRRWPEESARQDGRLAHLPADTRMPDHTIWTHMSLCSALQGCIENGELQAAFLIFQLGPVQDFISQAKSTLDLWSGSYLLSWLTANAIKTVTDEVGPDAVIYPSLRGQPIYDLLHKELYESIPFKGRDGTDETLWDRMYKDDINEGMRRLLTPTIANRFCVLVPAARASELAKRAEDAIEAELKKIGDAVWRHLEATDKVGTEIERRRWERQLDLFPQVTWQTMPWTEDIEPGKELKELERLALEVVPAADRDARNYKGGKLDLGFYWSSQYENANRAMAGRRNTRDFDQFITDEHQDCSVKDKLSGMAEEIKKNSGISVMTHIKREFANQYLQPLTGFTKGQFNYENRFMSTQAISKKNTQDGNSYIAVLALDGDEMGKWLSGEKTPSFIGQLSGKAKTYFEDMLGKDCELKRSVSPAYHLQFSEALSNFALYLAEKVVRSFDGQLIYAGGDDVLAMLPASNALECAEALRACFRGADIPDEIHRKLNLVITDKGFVSAGEGYPLLVPGVNADVSCGIVVGHDTYPLQALVREAQVAEKRAKNGYDRSAFAVSLIKRGGETIHWGAKWGESALPLYKQFSKLSEDEYLSNRFPYALAGLLKPYQLEARAADGKPLVKTDFKDVIMKEFDHVLEQQCLKKIGDSVKLEFRGKAVKYLDQVFEHGRPEDFINLFLTSTFMNRKRGE